MDVAQFQEIITPLAEAIAGKPVNKALKAALDEAKPHVYRQQHHGKHEQDRIDAVEWLEKWKLSC